MVIKIATLFLVVVLYSSDAVGYTANHYRNVDTVFPGIADPPVEHLKNKRVEPQWHIHNRNGALKFGSDSQIRQRNIKTPLRELLKIQRDTREILVLSGGHGTEIGNNWIDVINVRRNVVERTARAPWMYDPYFWRDDVEHFMGKIGDEFQQLRSRLRIVDMAEMTLPEFREILYSNKHVILGFCFGWNDRAFRYYLELQPVTSIVNPPGL